MSTNKTHHYVTIYFPENFPNRQPGGVPVRFRDEAEAEAWLRHNCFTWCPVHFAYAQLGTWTVNNGRRCRVVAVKRDGITEGWRLDYAAEGGAR